MCSRCDDDGLLYRYQSRVVVGPRYDDPRGACDVSGARHVARPGSRRDVRLKGSAHRAGAGAGADFSLHTKLIDYTDGAGADTAAICFVRGVRIITHAT